MSHLFKIALGGGGGEEYVDTVAFDATAKTLTRIGQTSVPNSSWIIAHPTAQGVYFATGELDGGVVRALQFGADGKTEIIAEQRTYGMHPTHLAVSTDGTELFVANYSEGGVGVLPIIPAAPYLKPDILQFQAVEFMHTPAAPTEPVAHSGFNPERQEASHPHQVLVLPAPHDEVLVPDLGSDKIWRLAKAPGEAEWNIVGFVAFPRGSGPRHAAFVDGVLYTVLELSNELSAHQFPPLPEEPTHIKTHSTLTAAPTHSTKAAIHPSSIVYTDSTSPTAASFDTTLTAATAAPSVPTPAGEDAPPQLAAEILVPPPLKADGAARFVYVSNRNEPSALGDSISVFGTHPAFALVARIATGTQHLRGLEFSPAVGEYEAGQFLALAGANGGGVKVYERKPRGVLELLETATLDLEGKSSIVWL
ncbi:3-carboxy-cis,cis-mucoante lactonizing enzyme [Auriculariales sp. MPI-PUGE-AT-0066]|nr:3-carboxy-cis,cis-mucoante lactonizing enzyme [Auriculariales sp. MPI-PUGE-AT-0066]